MENSIRERNSWKLLTDIQNNNFPNSITAHQFCSGMRHRYFQMGWEDLLPTQGHTQLEQKNHTQEFLPPCLTVSQLFIQFSSC